MTDDIPRTAQGPDREEIARIIWMQFCPGLEASDEDKRRYLECADEIIAALAHPVAVEKPASPAVDGVREALDAIDSQLGEMRSLKGWRMNLIRENMAKLRAALTSRVSAPVAGCGDPNCRDPNCSYGSAAAPSPALDPTTVEACAKVAKEMREKHGSPTGDVYSCGVWDQGVRIEQKIRALAGSDTSTHTVTDEMIERAIDAHVELFDSGDAVCAMREALTAALNPVPQTVPAWQSMDAAPRDGTRILLCWNDSLTLPAHVELGKRKGFAWVNTYGHAFSGEPTGWLALPNPGSPGPQTSTTCSHAAIIGLDGKWHCQKCGDAIEMGEAQAVASNVRAEK